MTLGSLVRYPVEVTRHILSVGSIDSSRLVPREQGVIVLSTVKPKDAKPKPKISYEENTTRQKSQSRAMKAAHKCELSNELTRQIQEREARRRNFEKTEKEEKRKRRQVKRFLDRHRSHTDPHKYPACGECRLVILNQTDKDLYYKKVWKITEASFRKDYSLINPARRTRGAEWHLDHKFSIAEGFRLDVDPSLIGASSNLTMLRASDNLQKKDSCSITLEELTEEDRSRRQA